MALSDEQCRSCQVELDKMKALPAELRWLPEAQDRVNTLENTLGSECSSSGGGAALVVLGALAVGAVGLLAALAGSNSGGDGTET
ncbi:hypothetical protein ES703_58801 [subsurface metagenome]